MKLVCNATTPQDWFYVSDVPPPDHGGQVEIAFTIGSSGPFVSHARWENGRWDWGTLEANKYRTNEEVYAWRPLPIPPPLPAKPAHHCPSPLGEYEGQAHYMSKAAHSLVNMLNGLDYSQFDTPIAGVLTTLIHRLISQIEAGQDDAKPESGQVTRPDGEVVNVVIPAREED